ncbi:MAG: CDP-alcohol phosphatidyltransferase family protein [Chloroflexaceae bacterium]|nr:CDP-alcohol phosphatidyltransferase family protein [Chloroflexaceae bacterium]
MFDHILRPLKDVLLTWLVRPFARVHPNTITVLAFLVGLAAAGALVQQHYLWGLVGWLLSRLLDGLDGAVARAYGKQSDFGGYLDILLDFAIYALIPLALVVGLPTTQHYFWLAILLGSFYLNAASWMHLAALLEKRAAQSPPDPSTLPKLTSVVMPAGIIAGAETISFYCLFILFPQYLAALFAAMALLVLLTVVQRLIWAARHLA